MNRRVLFISIFGWFVGALHPLSTDVSSASMPSPITKHIQALDGAIKLKNSQLVSAQNVLKSAKPGSSDAAVAADKVATLTSDIALLTTQKEADAYTDASLQSANDLVNSINQAQQDEDIAAALADDGSTGDAGFDDLSDSDASEDSSADSSASAGSTK